MMLRTILKVSGRRWLHIPRKQPYLRSSVFGTHTGNRYYATKEIDSEWATLAKKEIKGQDVSTLTWNTAEVFLFAKSRELQ